VSQTVIVQNESNSGVGTAGLIFSILGWVTCGLLCPIGAVLSFIGLFSKGAKGHAVAGLIVGFPGVLFLVFVGGGIIVSLLGLRTVTVAAMNEVEKQRQIELASSHDAEPVPPVVAEEIIEPAEPIGHDATTFAIPDEPTENATEEPETIVESKPTPAVDQEVDPAMDVDETPIESDDPDDPEPAEPEYREFSDVTHRFKIEAKYISKTDTTVTLKRKDNGKQVTLPINKLSSADMRWINEQD
jgi:hypothetical protein